MIGASAFAVEPPFVAEGVIIVETTKEELGRMKADLPPRKTGSGRSSPCPVTRSNGAGAWNIRRPFWSIRQGQPISSLSSASSSSRTSIITSIRGRPCFRLGRPMLSVLSGPRKCQPTALWSAGRIPRGAPGRATRAAALIRASRVTIVELCTSDQQDAARSHVRDVSTWLESHGASCQHDVRVHSNESDAGCLIRLAQEEGADLIVTGGYGIAGSASGCSAA